MTTRVVIADDHPIVRQGLRQIIADAGDVVVAAEATTGSELLALLPGVRCDIVLLDLSMPGSDGLDVLKTLRRDWPQTPVLVLTMHSEDQFAVRSLKAGASGYLTKDSAPSELMGAIRRIVAGGRYITPSIADRLVEQLDASAQRPLAERLSDREYQVLRLIAAGKTTREIARALSVSQKTIGTYRTRIREKLHLQTTAELLAFAVRHQLTD
jgi:two-component system, NarL family, invasion response regulator UvrY